MKEKIFPAYGIPSSASIKLFGHGLINFTWKIDDGHNSYILQKVNTTIFQQPEFIAGNIQSIASYLNLHETGYFFLAPKKTTDNKDFLFIEGACYRMFPFIQNSHTINVAAHPRQTYEAANKFGELTRLLSGFPVKTLHITLPDFHNISLRYQQLLQAEKDGTKKRIGQSSSMIAFLKSQKSIVDEFEKIQVSKEFTLRVTHHDTKINNVLFDENDKGICVIDLDTLMPGYFISDVGDMIRTHISPVDENEKDFSKIKIRNDYFTAVAEGYLHEMHDELSDAELHHFVYAGKFMVYMQALRFLTDYLHDDVYYGSDYDGHNYYRSANQAHLLQALTDKEQELSHIAIDIVTGKRNIKKQLS